MKSLFTTLLMVFCTAMLLAQGTISGVVVDSDTNEGLIGAAVYLEGTDSGTISDIDGSFKLMAPRGTYNLIVSYVGYQTMSKEVTIGDGETNLGKLMMGVDAIGIEAVEVLADVAIDRRTPVAVSTIKAEEIETKLGNQELPEILRSTPSIYATKTSGGFGDARINIRGFRQEDLALLINGIPVNGMEDNKVYWSNWAGLGDVTRTMQVQRGLGASKLAVASVGGTINIITKTTDQEKGGSIYTSIGNDGYRKTGLTLSTGLMDNGWAVTVSGSRTTGDGYIEGTYIDAWSYFGSISKQINDKSLIMLTGFGAPQRHGQRSFEHPIDDLENKYGIRWNDDFGTYQGKDFHIRENFYHKPQVGLSYINELNDKTTWTSSIYASVGRGGGTGDLGGLVRGDGRYRGREFRQARDEYGHFQFDEVRKYHLGMANNLYGVSMAPMTFKRGDGQTETARIAANGINGLIKRASMNEHQWYGALSNVTTDLTDQLTFSGGVDLRWYTGSHYRKVIDLLGADYWFDNDNVNNQSATIIYTDSDGLPATQTGHLVRPANDADNLWGSVSDSEKIDYHNDENINWYGAFGQLEYSNGDLSAFVSGGLNYTQMRRHDYFNKLDSDPTQTTDWLDFLGGNVKVGANFNLNDQNNVFVNAGYISRAPYFDALFPTYNNDEANEDAVNEKVLAFEAGYGFRSRQFNANINGYYTQWTDKTEVQSARADNGTLVILNLLGVDALHTGVELDMTYKPSTRLEFKAFGSLGDWQWKNNPTATITDDSQNVLSEETLYIDGLKVGDAAQTTFGISGSYEFVKGITLDASYNYFDNLYASYQPSDRNDEALEGVQPLLLPSYGLTDLGLTWKFDFFENDARLRLNVNNLFDTEYVSEAFDGETLEDTRGWFGFGRTWNATMKVNF